jgi:hypothetical protein
MRYFGHREIPAAPALPDTVLSVLLTAGTAQAFDYPTDTDLVRVTPGSTITGVSNVFFNPSSSGAAVATTAGAATTAAAGLNIIIGVGDCRTWQRPRASTGFSLVCVSSLAVSVEFWSRRGTTG